MGLHTTLIHMLQARQDRARLARKGPIGDFYRAGGNDLLGALPVTTDDVVIDAGGFEGDWAAAMLERFGCRVELFEPIPSFAEACRMRFAKNGRVRVHEAALGGSERTARFAIDSVASSEFTERGPGSVEARVVDIAGVTDRLLAAHRDVACLKLNIEGGEYEVLERLAGCGALARCRSVLVQFHAQPDGWEERLRRARIELGKAHRCAWQFPMVWELWETHAC
jgi:FkbM family methyltransferase